eukprot:TRINITY_DN12314_c1_g6_i1.p1 TRINITY_DN12314_c1_g6~~TRINITY_DN12314_c1_g6_i1.p1  ORF type:complete len:383 (+),score=81.14 TRINITY_DN12314_c1_g6_i1:138-1286(+)
MARFGSLLLLAITADGAKLKAKNALSFEEFMAEHGRDYRQGSSDYEEREKVFLQTQEKVHIQNSQPNRLWTASMNKYSDWFESELKAIRGYVRSPRHHTAGLSFSQKEDIATRHREAETMDWRNLTVSKKGVDQGACGSCWAVAAVTTLDAHHEIHRGRPGSFSVQELLNCVPNPRECGGKGGCEGATVELAMGYVQKSGLSEASEVPYTARTGVCTKSTSLLEKESSLDSLLDDDTGNAGASFGMTGFQVLPSNKYTPLLQAVASGPVAVSVAADAWSLYDSGIFDGSCGNIVDHAVTLFGYGKQGGVKYWIVKNSWGGDWGENGYIRLRRSENEESLCGIDNKPQLGLACKGENDPITTCGMCGILYDSVVPQFADIVDA